MLVSRTLRRTGAIAALSAAVSGCSLVAGPTAPDAAWNVYDSPRFSLYVRPGSFAEANAAQLAELLEDQYTTTTSRVAPNYHGRVSGFLHTSATDADLKYERSGVGYPDTETFKVACAPPLDAHLATLLAHEANHVIIRNGLGRPGTSFINEGLTAAVVSEKFQARGRNFLYAWARARVGQLPSMVKLVDDGSWTDYPNDVAYNASAAFIVYLLDTAGPEPLRAIYGTPSSGFARTFRQAYGKSLEEAEQAWKVVLASGPAW